MTNEQAYNILMKIVNLYNKNLNDEQVTLWLDELKPLDEITSRKVADNLKSNTLYVNHIPTIPQFLILYKSLSKLTITKTTHDQDYCYVCNNRGFDFVRKFKTLNGITYVYDYQLHCDCCEKGKLEEIRTNSVCSEPISMYCDINELKKINKIKRANALQKKSPTAKSKFENAKIKYALLSSIYS